MSVQASTVRTILASESFRDLVRKRIVVSTALTAIMLAVYFGFILTIAFFRELLAVELSEHLPLGLPVGIGIIILAWLLTGYYIRWANGTYDRLARDLRNKVLQQ